MNNVYNALYRGLGSLNAVLGRGKGEHSDRQRTSWKNAFISKLILCIRGPINPLDDSRKRAENVENEPVTQQTRTAGTSDAERTMRTYLA